MEELKTELAKSNAAMAVGAAVMVPEDKYFVEKFMLRISIRQFP